MISVATIPRAAPHPRPASTAVSRAAGLLRRDDLLAALDRASLRKVTVISAPPGSGKTSLLRVWSDRASKDRRVAFVTVPRDQQDAQEFWLAVLDAIRQTDSTADSRRHTAAPAFGGEMMVDAVISELAEAAGVIVLVIDDLHELSSADALSQLEHLLSVLPKSAHVVLSSRRDPPICGSPRARHANCSPLPRSACPIPGPPCCTNVRRVGRPACAWQ